MYACKKATPHSKKVTAKIIVSVGILKNINIDQLIIEPHEKVSKIFNNVWPDIIFAKSLIAKLNTLDQYDTPSIIIRNTPITKGTPVGRNSWKKPKPLKYTPTEVTLIKVIDAKKNEITKKLVAVELKGTIPKMFEKKTKKKMKAKYPKNKCFLKRILFWKIAFNASTKPVKKNFPRISGL